MKKSNILVILLIFVVPIALYYFFKMPSGSEAGCAVAEPGTARVLQFTSAMCYDCKRVEKEIAPLRNAPQYKGKISFQKIDISNRTPAINQLISRYRINVVPTLIFLDKNGKQQCRLEGYATKAQLSNCLDRIK